MNNEVIAFRLMSAYGPALIVVQLSVKCVGCLDKTVSSYMENTNYGDQLNVVCAPVCFLVFPLITKRRYRFKH